MDGALACLAESTIASFGFVGRDIVARSTRLTASLELGLDVLPFCEPSGNRFVKIPVKIPLLALLASASTEVVGLNIAFILNELLQEI